MQVGPAERAPSALLATLGNGLGQAARPLVLLLCGVAYGPAVVGELGATLALVVFATVAFYPALAHAVLRHRGGVAPTRGLATRMAWTVLACTLALAVAVAADQLAFGFLARALPDAAWLPWILVLAPLTVAEQYAVGLAGAAGILDRSSLAMAASRVALVAAAAVVAWMQLPPSFLLAVFAFGSAAALTPLVGPFARLPAGPAPPGLRRDGWAAAPNAWAWFLVAQASIVVVQAMMGSRPAGWFTFAYLLLNLPVLALQGIALAWSASASRHGAAHQWRAARRLVPRLVLGHTALVAALAAGGMVLWPRLFGTAMDPAFDLLARMALGAPGFALAYLLMPQWIARGWFKRLSATYLALAAGFLAALSWAASRGDLLALGWCTAGLGLGLAAVNLLPLRHWARTEAAPA